DIGFQPPHRSIGFDPVYNVLITNALMIPMFYLNLSVLIPKYIFKKKYLAFILFQVAMLALIYLVKASVFYLVLDDGFYRFGPRRIDIFPAITYAAVFFAALSYGLSKESRRKEKEHQERINENLQSELDFLRWQI